MELTNLQEKTINEILNIYEENNGKAKIEFTSPTGSGKTLMATYFISYLIERYIDTKFIFVIATPSNAELPKAFETKINRYKTSLPYNKFEVQYIESPSNNKNDKNESVPHIKIEENKIYIFGKASFGEKRLFTEMGIINDFIRSGIDNGYKIVYIRDEAHIGGKIDSGFEELMKNNASFIIKMTATPDYKDIQTHKVILRESDLNDDNKNDGKYLLKTLPQCLLNTEIEDTKLLDDAISNYKKIKEEYSKLEIGINPAMLIQVDNDSSNKEKSMEFKKNIQNIKNTLKKNNIAWVQYFGDGDKDSDRVEKKDFKLQDITQNSSEIEAIIFKVGPSTGWDIPRACMLVQLRNVCSVSLNTQTIGRIKRNPYPNLEKNDITNKYYIYSNAPKLNDDVRVYKYKIKDRYKNEELLAISINNKDKLQNTKQNKELKDEIKKYIEDNKNYIEADIKEKLKEDDGIKYYIKERITLNANGAIISKITNPFVLLKEYKKLIDKNKYIVDNIMEPVERIYKNTKISIEFVLMTLLNKHIEEIRKIINKHKQFEPTYKLEKIKYKPDSYIEIFSGDPKNTESTAREYMMEINLDENEKGRQPLDSDPEKIVFRKLHNFNEEYEGESFKLWAKNYTSSNINGEYIDENNCIRRSFFDFIVKFNNEVYLYIEVKGKQDIDKNKTELLKKAYESYFKQIQKDLINYDSKLIISIWKVDNKDGSIRCDDTYYDDKQIKENLKAKPYDEILKYLSEL